MPSLFGLITDDQNLKPSELLARMAGALGTGEQLASAIGDGWAVGVLARPGEPRLAAAGDQDQYAVMVGELFDTKSVRDRLVSKGVAVDPGNPAALLLALYQTEGLEALMDLNGSR